MKRLLVLIGACACLTVALIAPASASAANPVSSWSCTGNYLTDGNCTRADRYICEGVVLDAYRFYTNIGTQKVKASYVEERNRNTLKLDGAAFYIWGWGSPC